ncbi:nucleoside 2-deoxyribosyltransferase [Leptospira barantonii]|uniref:Nucleoside 2-deoxyribosyltransferase n=1 Tax=Leptospira barantonii TaxID=2023184 RepID=A0A5F2BH43_9LEPT|nr:nucleoside 2-deoxyribosyltransferase [Leptospira barantonii]
MKPDYGKYVEHLKPYDVFAKDNEELIFILNILKNKSYIIHDYFLNAGSLMWKKGAIIQEQGWLGIEHLELPLTSNKVFIAMWFDPSLDDAFLKMQMACDGNGFIGDRISNKEHNNEISGEILYEIRRSRFLIADVTGQRHGVYFEAGYAMGLGIPVIWSCREDHFKDVHFDTRQYNHVVWTDEKDLLEKLEKRIKGTIL